MSGPLADLLARADALLGERADLVAPLSAPATARASEATPALSAAAEAAARLLRARAQGLRAAAAEMTRLEEQVRAYAGGLRFRAEGWDERRAALGRALSAACSEGVALWLDDCFVAAAEFRVDALSRLAAEIDLPPALDTLRYRVAVCAEGLTRWDWNLAAPLLQAGVAGVAIGDKTLPDHAARNGLRLVALRIAIEAKRCDVAKDALEEVKREAPRLVHLALAARLDRAAGAPRREVGLDGADLAAADDPDIALALVEQARVERRPDVAREAARRFVDSEVLLADAPRRIEALAKSPPVEFWLALADRATDERAEAAAEAALARAREAAEGHAAEAALAEWLARRAERLGEGDQQVEALVSAARSRHWDGDIEASLALYREALGLQPDNLSATFGEIDARYSEIMARNGPGEIAWDRLEAALADVLAKPEADRLTPDHAWSFALENLLRLTLLRLNREDVAGHGWLALLAACRSLVFEPEYFRRWIILADAAERIGLYAVAATASRRASRLHGEARETEIRVLANCRRDAEALALLGHSPWDNAARASIVLRDGRAAESLSLLGEAAPTTEEDWIADLRLEALALCGRMEEARDVAAKLRARFLPATEERDALFTLGRAELVDGNCHAAAAWASRVIPNGDGELLTAAAYAAATGGAAEAAALAAACRAATRLPALLDLRDVTFPFVRAVAGPSPPLDAAEIALAARIAELQGRDDPFAELRDLPVLSKADPEAIRRARTLCAGLVALAGDDPARALAETADGPEGVDTARLRALAEASLAARHDSAAGAPAPPEPPNPSAPELRVLLPDSWFEGHEAPLETHPFFTRHVPAARLRCSGALPGVNVRGETTLEPGGWIVEVHGEIADAGALDPAALYAEIAAAPLLAAFGISAEPFADDPSLLVVAGADAADPRAALVLETSAEVVARRAARAWAARVPDEALRANGDFGPARAPQAEIESALARHF